MDWHGRRGAFRLGAVRCGEAKQARYGVTRSGLAWQGEAGTDGQRRHGTDGLGRHK